MQNTLLNYLVYKWYYSTTFYSSGTLKMSGDWFEIGHMACKL